MLFNAFIKYKSEWSMVSLSAILSINLKYKYMAIISINTYEINVEIELLNVKIDPML